VVRQPRRPRAAHTPHFQPLSEAGRAHLTHGALHDLDAAALAAARAQWAPTVGAAACPLVDAACVSTSILSA
jgi:hypothetical protein